jgi:hypothetical protein
MSDIEEVVIPRNSAKQVTQKNTKPEIAREKLKEKRERLKKEKENMIIEEAKKRLATDFEKKQQEEVQLKQQEEEKKKADPTYALMMRMEQMMNMFSKEPKVEEPEPEPEKPLAKQRKPRVKKEVEVVDKPNKSKGLPKPRKKIVYLQQNEPVQEGSTQFVGYDIAPLPEPVHCASGKPSSGLLSALMGRRNMNSFYN